MKLFVMVALRNAYASCVHFIVYIPLSKRNNGLFGIQWQWFINDLRFMENGLLWLFVSLFAVCRVMGMIYMLIQNDLLMA